MTVASVRLGRERASIEMARPLDKPTAGEVHQRGEIGFVYDDGGRAEAGFPPLLADGREPGDCACRSISIATRIAYASVHRMLADLADDPAMVDTGLELGVGEALLRSLDWRWTLNTRAAIPAPGRFDVELRHRRLGDLAPGRYVLEYRCRDRPGLPLSRGHFSAMIGGAVHDVDEDVCALPLWGWWMPAAGAITRHVVLAREAA
ncbi:MAG: hypothetical protein ACRDNS_02430 [Trebonia sp.]